MATKNLKKEDLTVGHEVFDTEHGVQIQLLEALEAALGPGCDFAGAEEILDRLLVFSDMHFGSEELLMRIKGFPSYAAHVEDHRRLLENLRAIHARIQNGDKPSELVDELHGWLVRHIKTLDRDFAAATATVSGTEGSPLS